MTQNRAPQNPDKNATFFENFLKKSWKKREKTVKKGDPKRWENRSQNGMKTVVASDQIWTGRRISGVRRWTVPHVKTDRPGRRFSVKIPKNVEPFSNEQG